MQLFVAVTHEFLDSKQAGRGAGLPVAKTNGWGVNSPSVAPALGVPVDLLGSSLTLPFVVEQL